VEIALPKQYVELEQEEMMYLDGGANGWWNSVDNVGTAIDVALIGVGLGVSIKTGNALAKLLRTNAGKELTRTVRAKIIGLFGTSAGAGFSAGIEAALTITGSSVGNLIAKGIDRVDVRRRNGYVFG